MWFRLWWYNNVTRHWRDWKYNRTEPSMAERRRSVYPGDEANVFVGWLTSRLGELSIVERNSATMVATPIPGDDHGGIMVGVRWTPHKE